MPSKTVLKTKEKQKDGRHKLTGPGPGRPKGKTNKFTDLKKAFLDTFEKIEREGGKKNSKVKTLYEWATANTKNQGMFYQMIAKMLPSNIDVDHKGRIEAVIISDVFLPKDANGAKPE